MNEELRKKLELALSAKGLTKELANFISIEEESDIEGVVAKLEKLHKTEKPKTLDDFLKDNPEAKSDFDRRMTKGIETYKKNTKKEQKPDEEDDDVVPEWAKKYIAKVEAVEAKTLVDAKLSEAKKLWKDSEIPTEFKDEKWFNRMIDVDSETSIEEQIKLALEETTKFRQEIVSKEIGDQGLPNPIGSGEASDEEIEDMVN